MNHSSSPVDSTAEETASLWAARLDGSDLSDESRRELSRWLNQDPSHRRLLTEYCQFSTDLEQKLPELLLSDNLPLSIPESSPPRRWWPRLVGGGLAAAAAIALLFSFFRPDTQQENLATPAAHRQSIQLVDGSSVDLDARTSLSIDIDKAHRRVRLAEGEAFFSVSKDLDRPFTVETPFGSVRVKGTQFDVHSTHQDSLQVTVVEGVVQVSPVKTESDTAPVLLHAGDQLALTDKGITIRQLSESDLADSIAWRRGQIVFKGTPLDQALDRFAHYHGIGISSSPQTAELDIGGRFSLDDLDGFLTALEEVLPVQISRHLNGTIQVNLRASPAPLHAGQ